MKKRFVTEYANYIIDKGYGKRKDNYMELLQKATKAATYCENGLITITECMNILSDIDKQITAL